jgi:predicted O-methyltransferase YrrM
MSALTHLLLWQLGLADAKTAITADERECITRYAAGRHRLVEIGVWHGATTCQLRSVMASDGVLYAVDPFPRGRLGFSAPRRIARREVARVRNGAVRWIRTTGAEAGRSLAGQPEVDFIFIDGDHSFDVVREDWETWRPLVALGGIVALHDSRPMPGWSNENAGSVLFTQQVVLADPDFVALDAVDTVTVLRRER